MRRPDGDVEWPVRRPDGDVELRDAGHGFHVPSCGACGGALKPDVVFFGDGVPKERADRWLPAARTLTCMPGIAQAVRGLHAWGMAAAALSPRGGLCSGSQQCRAA